MSAPEQQVAYAIEALQEIIDIMEPIEGGADRMDLYWAIGRVLGVAQAAMWHLGSAAKHGVAP